MDLGAIELMVKGDPLQQEMGGKFPPIYPGGLRPYHKIASKYSVQVEERAPDRRKSIKRLGKRLFVPIMNCLYTL